MKFAERPLLATLASAAVLLAATGCSVLEPDKIDYKSAGRGVSLEVPPDLTQLPGQSRYAVTGGAATASGYQASQAAASTATSTTAPNTIADVHFMRSGDERWLRVDRPPEKVWGAVRDFWLDNGFLIAIDQPTTGIMETDWAENRAKIPQDFIRNTLGRVLDSLYSTGERDKFRTRLERNAQGGTEIYVSHRGMQEVFNTSTKETTVWQPRAADPELEAEFLRRLLVKLGVSQEQAKAVAATPAARASSSRVGNVGGVPVVQIDEGFDRAWRRVGLALDRTGFTVEDRDRSQGVYFVRYVAPNADKKEPGFLGKLMSFASSEKAVPPLKYRIVVRSQGEATTVSVLNAAGAPESSANAESIVRVLAEDLK